MLELLLEYKILVCITNEDNQLKDTIIIDFIRKQKAG